jgi:hypothetical protein
MLTKHLNGTQVGSGTQIDFTAKGATSTDDGSKTTYNFDPMIAVATVTLTNAEIKALRATPKTLVAAPGAGKVIELVSAQLKLSGGTNALTESADNMAIRYTDGSGAIVSQAIEATGFIDQTAATLTNALPKIDAIVAYASGANKALVLHNTGDGEWGGNAAADVTMTVDIAYRVHTI